MPSMEQVVQYVDGSYHLEKQRTLTAGQELVLAASADFRIVRFVLSASRSKLHRIGATQFWDAAFCEMLEALRKAYEDLASVRSI